MGIRTTSWSSGCSARSSSMKATIGCTTEAYSVCSTFSGMPQFHLSQWSKKCSDLAAAPSSAPSRMTVTAMTS